MAEIIPAAFQGLFDLRQVMPAHDGSYGELLGLRGPDCTASDLNQGVTSPQRPR